MIAAHPCSDFLSVLVCSDALMLMKMTYKSSNRWQDKEKGSLHVASTSLEILGFSLRNPRNSLLFQTSFCKGRLFNRTRKYLCVLVRAALTTHELEWLEPWGKLAELELKCSNHELVYVGNKNVTQSTEHILLTYIYMYAYRCNVFFTISNVYNQVVLSVILTFVPRQHVLKLK